MKAYNSPVGIKPLIVLLLMSILLFTGCGSVLTTSVMRQADETSEFSGPKLDKNQLSETAQEPEQKVDQNSGQSLDQNQSPDQDKGTDLKESDNLSSESSTNPEFNPDSEQTVPEPNPPGTPIRPFYSQGGDSPKAPGLAMKSRLFQAEPKKIVYLTFDDGPHPSTTPKILKILQEENVPATFFVIGNQAERYPDLLKAEYEGGYGIGNHTYSHDYKEIYESHEAFLASIRKSEDVIEGITGERPTLIRAPGGTHTHFSVALFNLLDAQNYLIYDWNVSIGDTAAPLVPVKQLINNLQTQITNRNRAIILMHDAGYKTTTVEALPQMIKYLKDKGYEFGVLSPKVMPIIFPGGFSR